ncbi:hypothetical protein BRC71_08365 [Halobacteriales archaeon QH_7_65_31]|nr:MAG: hypothetical protein BRC71_08365 [Halobacteriales archaeon QH_7_65_31]
MTDYGNIDVEQFFTGDPIEDWLDLKRREDISTGTVDSLVQKLQTNSDGTAFQQFLSNRDVGVLDATVMDLYDYRDFIREVNSKREMKNKLSEVSTFYNDMRRLKQTDSNPAAFVLSRTDTRVKLPNREYHTVEAMGDFLAFIPHPQMQTMCLCYLKYGLRRGAVVNIDLCCVNIDDPRYRPILMNAISNFIGRYAAVRIPYIFTETSAQMMWLMVRNVATETSATTMSYFRSTTR